MAVRTDKNTERALHVVGEPNTGNGAHLLIESTTGSHGENSVEKSLEDFIARANSMFLDGDGWDLGAEDHAATAPAAELKGDLAPRARTEEVPALSTPRAMSPIPTSIPVQTTDKVAPALARPSTPVGEKRAALAPDPMLLEDPTKETALPFAPVANTGSVAKSWLKMGAAFVVGAVVMFVVANKLVGGGKAAPATPETKVPPTSTVQAVETLTPPAARATTASAPAPIQSAAGPARPVAVMEPMPPIEVGRAKTTAPAAAKVVVPVRPRAAAAPPVPVAKPKAAAPIPTPKGGITDPFADTPSPAPRKAPAAPPQKPKKPSGGIVDPFAM